MQSITLYSLSASNNTLNKKVSFTGGPNLQSIDHELSLRASKLVKRAGRLIDETWPKVKKKAPMTIPEFKAQKGEKSIILKPVYNLIREAIHLEVKDGKYIEIVTIDRANPNIFKYEKAIKTDHGSATVKTYNSKNGHHSEMLSKVNEMVETYLPSFVPDIPARKHQHIL